MSASYDLVIRGGVIVDGTGRPGFAGDVAVRDGRIAAVGQVEGQGAEEIDATGRLVTPGFVDIHTHYDGQVTWANRLGPSSQHGVTTVLMGNCGVGFAPCRPKDRERLVFLMEGVEDIPEIVMTKGLPWNWESFGDYLDSISQRRFDVDVAAQLPHAALRVYVMGERAAAREPATPEDIAQMRRLASEAVRAGAIGFSTSRSLFHKATDGTVTPTFGAGADELAGIAQGLKDADKGVLQLVSDFEDVEGEFAVIRQMLAESRRPISLTVLQHHHDPDRWRRVLTQVERVSAEGHRIKAQVCARPIGIFMGMKLARHPFMRTTGYREIEHLPLAERTQRMREPAVRARILSEMPGEMSAVEVGVMTAYPRMFEFKGDYEPGPEQNFSARAAALGVEPIEVAYDVVTAGEGEAVVCMPAVNFAGNSTEAIEGMMAHEHTILGLGDGGAHCGMICDASLTTHMLQRWSDAGRGPIPVEQIVKALSAETAQAIGLFDRGVIAPGLRADLNVIDASRIAVGPHEMVGDLPNGAERLHQSASGYDATIVAGQVTYRDGVATGALPGRLVRGAQPAA
jgi:N-acyl-D-aspartate/D-glutamate deacylase